MPRFMTRHGLVTFRAKKTKAKTKKAPKKKSTKKASKKTMSKKVGRWRVECHGRTVYAAGAKHAYKTPAAACAAYKKLTSVKSVEGFVGRYGKKKTKQVVVGGGKKKATKKKAARRKNPNQNWAHIVPIKVKCIKSMPGFFTKGRTYKGYIHTKKKDLVLFDNKAGGSTFPNHALGVKHAKEHFGINIGAGGTRKKAARRKNPCGSRRRNAPVSDKDAAAIKRILRKHGYR